MNIHFTFELLIYNYNIELKRLLEISAPALQRQQADKVRTGSDLLTQLVTMRLFPPITLCNPRSLLATGEI